MTTLSLADWLNFVVASIEAEKTFIGLGPGLSFETEIVEFHPCHLSILAFVALAGDTFYSKIFCNRPRVRG